MATRLTRKTVAQSRAIRSGSQAVPTGSPLNPGNSTSSIEGDFVFALSPGSRLSRSEIGGTFEAEITGVFGGSPYTQPITVTFVQTDSHLSGHWVSPGGSSGSLVGEVDGADI